MSGEAPRTLQATRGGGVFNYLPFTTTFFMCACLGTFLLQFFLPDVASTGEFAITPGFIVFYFQWYRLISSAFFHGGLLHIGFNMMTLYALGTSLERQLGSLHMFVTSWIILLTSGFMYTAACMLLWAVTGAQGWLLYSAVGYSGVLFGMAVQESALSFLPTRSVFGCFNVPTKWYPWVLMVVLQLVMPNISLLGHLCGAVAGFLHIHGYLSWVTPSLDGVKAVEEAAVLQCCVRRPNYVLAPTSLPRPEGDANLLTTLAGCVAFAAAGLRPIVACVWNATVGRVAPGWTMAGSSASAPPASAGQPAPRRMVNGVAVASTPAPAPAQAPDLELGAVSPGGDSAASAGHHAEQPSTASWPSALLRGDLATRAQGYAPVSAVEDGEEAASQGETPAPQPAPDSTGNFPQGQGRSLGGDTVQPSRGRGQGRLAHSRLLAQSQ